MTPKENLLLLLTLLTLCVHQLQHEVVQVIKALESPLGTIRRSIECVGCSVMQEEEALHNTRRVAYDRAQV